MHINEFKTKIFIFINSISRFLPFVFWILFLYGFDEPFAAGLTMIAAILHEMGHVGYLFLKTGDFYIPKGVLSGMRITPKRMLSFREEFFLYISGPLVNIVIGALFLAFKFLLGEWALAFAAINFASGIGNLLPIEGYDGYGALRALFSEFGAGDLWVAALREASLIFVSLLCFLSLYMMDRLDGGYWIFAIFISALISRFCTDSRGCPRYSDTPSKPG